MDWVPWADEYSKNKKGKNRVESRPNSNVKMQEKWCRILLVLAAWNRFSGRAFCGSWRPVNRIVTQYTPIVRALKSNAFEVRISFEKEMDYWERYPWPKPVNKSFRMFDYQYQIWPGYEPFERYKNYIGGINMLDGFQVLIIKCKPFLDVKNTVKRNPTSFSFKE